MGESSIEESLTPNVELETPEKVEKEVVSTTDAEDEYRRVFENCLENNFDLEGATKAAKKAMRNALDIVDSSDEEENEDQKDQQDQQDQQDQEEDEEVGEESFPPLGVSVVTPPDGGTPGIYNCDLCEVTLKSEVELEEHLVTEEHVKAFSGSALASIHNFPHGPGAGTTRGKGVSRGNRARGEPSDPKRGKVYKGRPNAMSSDTMKAQRGRRGLISFGEVMPAKLTKGQKKINKEKNNIAAVIGAHKIETALNPGDDGKTLPLLQAFIKGKEDGELHQTVKYQMGYGPGN